MYKPKHFTYTLISVYLLLPRRIVRNFCNFLNPDASFGGKYDVIFLIFNEASSSYCSWPSFRVFRNILCQVPVRPCFTFIIILRLVN